MMIRARYGANRAGRLAVAVALLLALTPACPSFAQSPKATAAAPAAARAMRGELSVTASDGYARLLFRFDEGIETDVKLSGSVLIVSFDRPVDLPLAGLTANAPDYLGAVRRDPNGMAIRFALARRVSMNAIPAAEKLFIDLMPETWTGAPPSLPMDVIQDLAQRARAADRMMAERKTARPAPPQTARVRMSRQPTFTRYSFDVPDDVSIGTGQGAGSYTLTFGRAFEFDFSETRTAAPPYVPQLTQRTDDAQTVVQFGFTGGVKVRTFRDDQAYVVDVYPVETKPDAKSSDNKPQAPKTETPDTIADAKADAKPDITPSLRMPESATLVPTPAAPAIAAPATAPARETRGNVETAPTTPAEAAPRRAEAPLDLAPERGNAERLAAREAAPEKSQPEKAAPESSESEKHIAEKPMAEPPAAEKSGAEIAAEKPAAAASGIAPPRPVVTELRFRSDGVRLVFPFRDPTPAAMFRRGDNLWLAFDTEADINLTAMRGDTSQTVRDPQLFTTSGARLVRMRLDRSIAAGLSLSGNGWTVLLGAPASDSLSALGLTRQITSPATVEIAFEKPAALHRFTEPDTRDTLLIVTGTGPVRGIPKDHEFVEFRVQSSVHGLVVVPKADDVNVVLSPDRVTLTRPGGLTISSGGARQTDGTFRTLLDYRTWLEDRGAKYRERMAALMNAVATSPPQQRSAARLDLARFLMAKKLYVEAKAILDNEVAEPKSGAEGASAILLRGIANLLLERTDQAAKDFAEPSVAAQFDIQLWRGITLAAQNRWADAREVFASVNMSLLPLPPEIQLMALKSMMAVALESGDTALAAARLNEIDSIRDLADDPRLSMLRGRLADTLGQTSDARAIYHAAAQSGDRALAAQGLLAELLLDIRGKTGEREDIVAGLETLTAVWRGDDLEVRALRELARLYGEDNRWRDAFSATRTALQLRPNSAVTRQMHDEAIKEFDGLFLGGKADALPVIEALGIFYDFQDYTPVGRRGDEMIRRLATRLVTVDLLDQASDLLQYQIEQRLQGAAKSQIAIRLATIHLMNRKPEKAVAVLRATRAADLSTELRNQRLLLEARAQSELGRHDLALEIIGNLSGRDVLLLRSDVLWNARRWREAAETIELVYETTRADKTPMNDVERADLLRAAIGYTLSNDGLGTMRFAEKFAPRITQEQDKAAFKVANSPASAGTAAFRDIAKLVARVDRLSAAMREAIAEKPAEGDAPAADDTPQPRQQSRRDEPGRLAANQRP